MFEKRQINIWTLRAIFALGLTPLASYAAAAPQTPGTSSSSPGATDSGKPESLQRVASRPGEEAERLGLIQKTTDLIGRRVEVQNWTSVGKVEDLVLDLSDGLVIVAFVSSGSETEVTPVPPESFRAADKDMVTINTDRKTFTSAPKLPKPISLGALNADSLGGTFRHFHKPTPDIAGAGGFLSAAVLVGAPLISQDNQPLGQLDNIMVDLPAGQVVYLVVKPSVGGDPQRDRYVLPPSSVKRDASGQTLVLKADQAHFVAGPHFQPEFWVDMSRPELAAAVREHYPTQASTADPTRQPVRARLETPSSVTAPAASDEEITRAVKRQIMSALALDAEGFITQGIKVKTVNGRVTLTGHLKNEKEKQQVVTAAERAAGAGRVDDQLEPRTK